MNVNHTVDSAEPDDGSQEAPEMKSKPTFEVDLVKADGRTLSFTCTYIYDHDGPEKAAQEEGYGKELFGTRCIYEIFKFGKIHFC